MDDDYFAQMLRALYSANDERLREKYHRSLPFADGLFDRWERARRLGFGAGASIYNSALVFGEVQVGENTWVGPNTILDGSGGKLSIGSFCSVSAGVHIYTHDSVLWALSGGIKEFRQADIAIGDSVYIGSQSMIALGVSIGSRCVIAANSFVNRDIPEGTVVAGSPAKSIGWVEGHGDSVHIHYGIKSDL